MHIARALLFATTVLGSVAYIASERHGSDTASSTAVQRALASPHAGAAARTTSQDAAPITVPEVRFDPRMAAKYDVLLTSLDPTTRTQLQNALVARETEGHESFEKAAKWEREISLLLREDDYVLYELLRESDRERAEIDALARHLSPSAPLNERQRRDLLIAKLANKYEMQALELRTETQRTDISAMEAGYAHDVAAQGVAHYEHAFRDSARSILTEEQWIALSELEDPIM
jgi:hypothetical protein